jgi:hypothetical protein
MDIRTAVDTHIRAMRLHISRTITVRMVRLPRTVVHHSHTVVPRLTPAISSNNIVGRRNSVTAHLVLMTRRIAARPMPRTRAREPTAS